MPFHSMTGFSRGTGQVPFASWVWEVKSVNGRGLEMRARLPQGFDALDMRVRALAQEHCRRGNLQVSLSLVRTKSQTQIRINDDALQQILAAMERLDDRIDADEPTLDGIMGLKGVIETIETPETEEEHAELEEALIASLRGVFQGLARSRAEEGTKLQAILRGQIGEIARLVAEARGLAATQPAAIAARLREQVAQLLDAANRPSEERLAQEVALLAAKADIREELDRLTAHVSQGLSLLDEDAAGRRLDFLTQEFMREANTLCSKAADIELTRLGLSLKAVIDQMREQVQNVE
ncbi:MAG: YicC family protein [Alphaproteobacteria bacterium]|nr:YicC family protein [Alphaproteobacteria bacterium]